MTLSKSRAAFTLLELLVVVATIGILASVALPKYNTFKARAAQTEAKGLLASAFTFKRSFYAEHDTYSDMVSG